MQMPELQDFSLVGGTALALKLGHRISIDIDLFSSTQPDFLLIKQSLEREFGKCFLSENIQAGFALFAAIHNVKTDILHYPHSLIAEIEVVDGVRMYSNKDIAAMKVNAMLGRGQKKDFFDLAELLKQYTLAEIISWHRLKYPDQQFLISA